MDRDTVLRNQDVWVRNGIIEKITGAEKKGSRKDAREINGTGKFLMPGLAEMHAHVPPVDNLAPMKEVLTLFAVNGITTIRGMLGHPLHLELRTKIRTGEIPGPRLITSGPSLNGNSVKTPEDGPRIVEAQKEAGYDFLKLHPGLTPETFAPIVARAKELKMPFAGHVSFKVGVQRAIDAGYATIDHMDGFMEYLVPGMESVSEQEAGPFALYVGDRADLSRIPSLVEALLARQIWVVPTQSIYEKWFSPAPAEDFISRPEMVYMSPQTRAAWVNSKKNVISQPQFNKEKVIRYMENRRVLLKALYDGGVGILLGSDAPQVFDVPGFSAHDELVYYVLAGLTPYQALRTGTVHAGLFLKDDRMGTIRPGSYADLVLLSANPLESINNTRKIEGVMLQGRWMDQSHIAQTLKSLEKK
jgi:imidazolonepropionase-like amidohydrolase